MTPGPVGAPPARTGLFSIASGAGAKGVFTGLMPAFIILANSTALILFYLAAAWRFNNRRLSPELGCAEDRPENPGRDEQLSVRCFSRGFVGFLVCLANLPKQVVADFFEVPVWCVELSSAKQFNPAFVGTGQTDFNYCRTNQKGT